MTTNLYQELRDHKPLPWTPPQGRSIFLGYIFARCPKPPCTASSAPFLIVFNDVTHAYYSCTTCGCLWVLHWDAELLTEGWHP